MIVGLCTKRRQKPDSRGEKRLDNSRKNLLSKHLTQVLNVRALFHEPELMIVFWVKSQMVMNLIKHSENTCRLLFHLERHNKIELSSQGVHFMHTILRNENNRCKKNCFKRHNHGEQTVGIGIKRSDP